MVLTLAIKFPDDCINEDIWGSHVPPSDWHLPRELHVHAHDGKFENKKKSPPQLSCGLG